MRTALPLAAGALLLSVAHAACRSPEAGVELVVTADAALLVDQLVIGLSAGGAAVAEVRAPEEPRALAEEESVGLVLREPSLVGADVTIAVAGLSAAVEVALGETEVATKDGEIVEALVELAPSFACGDGEVHEREACDDGNNASGDGCDGACTVESGFTCDGEPSVCERCGDGALAAIERCDDGNNTSGDGCDAVCAVEDGYECGGEPSLCATVCGDGLVVGGEECDDGNGDGADGCSGACALEDGFTCAGAPSACTATCGDGLIVGDEGCDDGNGAGGDGCSAACAGELGYSCSGEPSQCATVCGDGIPAGDEECDDGAANDDAAPDACRTSCALPACGDEVVDSGEQCDDADVDNTDGCLTSCRLPGCGDGFVAVTEECDDANAVDADGCSGCLVDGGQQCGGAPSVCASDAEAHVVDGAGGGEFTTIAAAVSGASSGDTLFIRPGTYGAPLTISKDLTLVGDGAVVVDVTSNDMALRVSGGADVAVHALTLRHAGNDPVVKVEGAGSALELVGCTVGPGAGLGVEVAGNSSLALSRTLVTGNAGGGVQSDGNHAIESSAFVGNGSASAAVGGIALKRAGAFRFNTVAGNQSSGAASGVSCQQPIALESSLVYGNAGTQLAGPCDASSSSTTDPLFDDDGFHLTAASPAKNAGPASACPALDIDGDARPLGSACDLGADERP